LTQDEDGIYIIATKIERNVKLPHVAPDEDSGPFTKALLASPPGKNLIGYRSWLTLDEYLEVWSRALGIKAKAVKLPYDLRLEGVPEEIDEEMAEMAGYCADCGYEARDDPSLIHPKDVSCRFNGLERSHLLT
jgi:hypothetical protein